MEFYIKSYVRLHKILCSLVFFLTSISFIRYKVAVIWYWFSLCFPRELLMSFWSIFYFYCNVLSTFHQNFKKQLLASSVLVLKDFATNYNAGSNSVRINIVDTKWTFYTSKIINSSIKSIADISHANKS